MTRDLLCLVALLAAAAGCGAPEDPPPARGEFDLAGAEVAGGDACVRCHRVQASYWSGSSHHRALLAPVDVRRSADRRAEATCEACHGPGSVHLAWAEARARGETPPPLEHRGLTVRLEDPGRGTWIVSPETGKGLRLAPAVETREVEVCLDCHAATGTTAYLASVKHREGVTCSDCHEPHGLGLIFAGDKVCARCHAVDRFETPRHHFHRPGEAGSRCVDCHMPAAASPGGVEPRRDHSLGVPRLVDGSGSGAIACGGCHRERGAAWVAAAFRRWYASG